MPRKAESGDFMIIPAGCLDQWPELLPERTIFWGNRARWFEAACEAERFTGYNEKASNDGKA